MSLLILSGGPSARARAWVFALGVAMVTLAIGLPGVFLFGRLAARTGRPDRVWAVLDLLFGLVLLALAVRMRVKRPTSQENQSGKASKLAGAGLPVYLGVGAVMMLTNFSTLALYVPLLKGIARSAGTPVARLLVLLADVVIIVLPAWLPPVVVTLGGERAQASLDRLHAWLERHRRTISMVVLIVFGVYLTARGVVRLAG